MPFPLVFNIPWYKWCIVTQCRNTSISSPDKLFVSVPKIPKRRKKWLMLAGRDPNSIQMQSNVFMCEDHFDMEKDTTNYLKYKMGFCQKIYLTDDAVPNRFDCQKDRKRQLSDDEKRQEHLKRQRIVTECLQNAANAKTHTESPLRDEGMVHEIVEPEELPRMQDKETTTDPIKSAEKSVQVKPKFKHYRSKAIQAICQHQNSSTSPMKCTTISRYTSPFKIVTCYQKPSLSGVVKKAKRNIFREDEKSDSDISCFESGHSSSFVPTSSARVTDSDSYVTDTNENIDQLLCLRNTVRLIEKKPMMYIGISKECYVIIQLLSKHTNIKVEHILLCLKKIRMNTTFSELEDNFGISLSYASKLFLGNIPRLSSFLKPFIVNIDKKLIKKNLPIAFRHNYHNVSCIIDCLEIDIQKPSKAVHQALTWSEYKKGNTVKYLISCTPNGLINFVSQGFGGRTTDVTIVENCDFLKGLQEGSCILADRGFKHLEQALHEKGIKLIRPPSVITGEKLTKSQVRQTKVIASLRILIERAIRRVREFHMLKQHSTINTNILRVLDHVIIIACALINLQDSLIK